GSVVVLGGQGAHGVEQRGLTPVLLFTATGKDHVLLAHLDLLHGRADAVCAGGTGGGDRVVDALDLEGGGQTGGNGAAHGARHAIGPDLLHAFLAQDVHGFHLVQSGSTTAAGDQAGTHVADLLFTQAGIGDGLLHGQVGEGGGITHEALDLAVNGGVQVNLHAAGNLAAQAHFCVFGVMGNAGLAFFQAGSNAFQILAKAGDDAHTGNHDATHSGDPQKLSVEVNRPTRSPSAV